MKFKTISLFSFLAVLALLLPATLQADVRDNAQIFSPDAVDAANRDMARMERTHNKQLVVETFAAVPDDQKDAEKEDPKTFFHNWMATRFKELRVNGVYVLICMDPRHLELGADRMTLSRGDFTQEDLNGLRTHMQSSLRSKDYDNALSCAVEYVDRTYTENIQAANSRNTGGTYQPNYVFPPAGQPPVSFSNGSGTSFGTLICFAVGAVIIISLIRSVFRGGSGGFGSYGGGYYPGNQGYGAGFGGYGGGGGFGRGLLGGLLGGALGSYAENRFEDRSQGSGGFFQGGQNAGAASSFDSGPSSPGDLGGSSAGDFGSSGDAGGGGGGSSSGDF